jgi:hypothetical protein
MDIDMKYEMLKLLYLLRKNKLIQSTGLNRIIEKHVLL